jgi:hypothetical protein
MAAIVMRPIRGHVTLSSAFSPITLSMLILHELRFDLYLEFGVTTQTLLSLIACCTAPPMPRAPHSVFHGCRDKSIVDDLGIAMHELVTPLLHLYEVWIEARGARELSQ